MWILDSQKGKIQTIAKGVRKIKSKRGGHIDTFNLIRSSIHAGKTFDIITETVSVNTFNELKSQFKFHFFYLAELINKITLTDEEATLLFEIIYDFLDNATNESFLKILSSVELKILKLLGFTPNLKTFSDTDSEFNLDDLFYVNPNEPGFTSEHVGGIQISSTVIKAMRFLISQNAQNCSRLNVDKNTTILISRINRNWIQSVLDTRFKSLLLIKD